MGRDARDADAEQADQSSLSRYLDRTPTSRDRHHAAKEWMPGGTTRTVPYFPPYPLTVESAEAETVTDVDGNTYVDFLNCFTAVILGHCHPAIREAVSEQLSRLDLVAACTEPEQRLAERLTDRVGGLETVRFANSGTEAVMTAVRGARAYTGRDTVAIFEGSYNGSTDELLYNYGTDPKLSGTPERPRPLTGTAGAPDNVAENVVVLPWNRPDAVTDILAEHADDLACVLASPAMGKEQVDPVDGFHGLLADLCDEHGAVYILDEVIGYREGYHGAQDVLGVEPDMTTMGKIVGGGFPIGVFGGRADIMSSFDATTPDGPQAFHSGTFTANLPTMAAANASLDLLDEAAFDRLNALGADARARLREAVAEAGLDIQVTGRGSMFHLWALPEDPIDYRSLRRADPEVHHRIFVGLLNRGFFTGPGLMGCLTLPMDEGTVDSLGTALEDVLGDLRPDLERTHPELVA